MRQLLLAIGNMCVRPSVWIAWFWSQELPLLSGVGICPESKQQILVTFDFEVNYWRNTASCGMTPKWLTVWCGCAAAAAPAPAVTTCCCCCRPWSCSFCCCLRFRGRQVPSSRVQVLEALYFSVGHRLERQLSFEEQPVTQAFPEQPDEAQRDMKPKSFMEHCWNSLSQHLSICIWRRSWWDSMSR